MPFPSPRRPLVSLFLRALGAAGLALGLFACGGEGVAGAASGAAYPSWTGMDQQLFADEIDPAALGLGAGRSPRGDKTLWARSTEAEVVGRVRVQTVTVDTRLGEVHYHLGLQFAEPLLAPSRAGDGRVFEVTVEPRDPAYGLLKALDTTLQGRTFVGFVKRFRGRDDEAEVHFFLAADSAEVAKVVQEAVALSEMNQK